MSSPNDYCLAFDLATPWTFLRSLVASLQCMSLAFVQLVAPYAGPLVRTHVMNWQNVGCFVLLLALIWVLLACLNSMRWYHATYLNVPDNYAWMQHERFWNLVTRWGGLVCHAVETLCNFVGEVFTNGKLLGYHLVLLLVGVLGFLLCVLAVPLSVLTTIVCLLICIVLFFCGIMYGVCWCFKDALCWMRWKKNAYRAYRDNHRSANKWL